MKKYLFTSISLIIFAPLLIFGQGATKANINSTLTGSVVDGRNGLPLEGAVIHIKGTTHEVLADNAGKFNFLTGQRLPYILIVSHIGYQTTEITASENTIRIALKESLKELDEVVMT